jgi:hypothetical protein
MVVKKRVLLIVVILSIGILSMSFVSAGLLGWFKNDNSKGSLSGLGISEGTCVDDDGGFDLEVKGTCSGGDGEITDVCINEVYYKIKEAACDTNTGNCYINFFPCPNGCFNGACREVDESDRTGPVCTYGVKCKDEYHAVAQYTTCAWSDYERYCELGCLNGVCIKGPPPTCIDTDGGRDYYNKGTLTAGDYTADDFCSLTTQVWELFCTDDGYKAGEKYTCPDGCLNGACLKPSEIPCTDSDNGKNYLQKGTTANSSVSSEDSCNNGVLKEYSCSGTRVNFEYYDCKQNGYTNCLDGACVNDICVDSDNGKNYLIDGTVTTSTTSYKDRCDAGLLKEYFCSNGLIDFEYYNCEQNNYLGCFNGFCVEQSSSGCTDTDSLDVYSKGRVYYQGNTFEDQCFTSSGAKVSSCSGYGCELGERYCDRGVMKTHYYDGAYVDGHTLTSDIICNNGILLNKVDCIDKFGVEGGGFISYTDVRERHKIRYFDNGVWHESEDYCEGNVINEFICAGVRSFEDYKVGTFRYAWDCSNLDGNGWVYNCIDGECVGEYTGSVINETPSPPTPDNESIPIAPDTNETIIVPDINESAPITDPNTGEIIPGIVDPINDLGVEGEELVLDIEESLVDIQESTITGGNTEAVSQPQLSEDNGKVYADHSKGTFIEIKISPDEAVEFIKQKIKIKKINKIKIIEYKEIMIYEIDSENPIKIFALIPANMKMVSKVNVDNGDIIDIKKPWWSFIAEEI